MKIKEECTNGRFAGLRRLACNKWSLTIAVMLLMLSVYVTMEQPGAADDVLYVTDTLPYEVQKVSGGDLQVIDEPDVDLNDMDDELERAGQFDISSEGDYFINYRLEREKARARQLELLQDLIDDETTDETVRAAAQERVLKQAEAIEQELMLESILVARYGGDAAVFVQAGRVSVVLGCDEEKMSDREAEKIAMLVDNYTGIGYENVVVVIRD